MSTENNEIWQLIEHHYFELENNKGISNALDEYSNMLSDVLFNIDEEVSKLMQDFESVWLNEEEKRNGISERYLEFVKKEIEREITNVVNNKLEHWANVKS